MFQEAQISEEALLSICQRAAKLSPVKVGGLKKNSATRPESKSTHAACGVLGNFCHPQSLTDHSFVTF